MFGIGPMLPVIPAAEYMDPKKARKRKQKRDPDAGSYELPFLQTETTLIESNDEYSVKGPECAVHHQRDLSLTLDWKQEDFERMVRQLHKGVISDLDLSLFAFWIKAKHDNYLFAKDLVRELALDQGYMIDRIPNSRLRKLLQEVHDVRPRDPRNASTWESPFHSQTRTSSKIGNNRVVASPLTARTDTLPPSLRLERERAVQEAARVTMMSSDVVDYPPNTPDRPAPLSVKSRGSRASNATPMPNTILRSISTPIRTHQRGGLDSIPQARASVVIGDTEILSLASLSTTKDSVRDVGDVFNTTHEQDSSHSDLFAKRLHSGEEKRQDKKKRYMYNDADCHHYRGPFQLDASDVASESSYMTLSSLVQKSRGHENSSPAYDGGLIGDDSFDALESYVGTEDEDECSILESASTISEHDIETQYQYAVSAPPTNSIIAGPAPSTSQRRATADARRKSQALALATSALNFHRPLPLRSYESEATMFPTAGAQANSGQNRAKSVTSIIASQRHATESIPHPPLPGSSRAWSSTPRIEQEDHMRDDSHVKISEQVNQYVASLSQCSSSASTLAAFPIPPMENPVGKLPMLVSRATSRTGTLQTTASQHLVASASPEDTYRAIIKVNMVATLQRTRARGEQLEIVQWEQLNSFERAWREMNEVLLVIIYGRKDVVLSKTDVEYVDCVVKELMSSSNGEVPMEWVRHIFEKDG